MVVFIVLLSAFFIFVVSPIVYLRGLNIGAASAKPTEYKHQHIWDKWQDQKINYFDSETGQKLYSISGQTRVCEDCGFRESREVE